MKKMKYVIIYFDKYGFNMTEEERTKKMEIYTFDTLYTAIDVLQKNKYVIISVELKEY